jgi:predicted aconitase
MTLLVRYAEVVGAERFVAIGSAHIDGCLYHGPSSIDFVRSFVALDGRVRVPTTLNVGAVDLLHPELNLGEPDLLDHQAELTALHEALGCVPTMTCAPYQRFVRPRRGEHVAWAESNAIVFVNSVLGARTDRYGDFTDLCAALTGFVPLAGLHLDENRRARLIVEVPDVAVAGVSRDLYFASVGYCLGALAGHRVAALVGLPQDATEDELKGLGAAAASSGAVGMFHAVGVTPEAATLDEATGGARERTARCAISKSDLGAALHGLCPIEEGERVAAVCLGTPHFSMEEFRRLAEVARAHPPSPGVKVYVSTSREIAAQLELAEWAAALNAPEFQIVTDVCTYMAPIVATGRGAVLSNSAKWVHYAPGNVKLRAALLSLEDCMRSASAGRVARGR